VRVKTDVPLSLVSTSTLELEFFIFLIMFCIVGFAAGTLNAGAALVSGVKATIRFSEL
jgi:hypothetical protein